MLMTTTEAIPGFQVEQVLELVEASSGWAVTRDQIRSAVIDDRTRLPIDPVEAPKDVAPDPR